MQILGIDIGFGFTKATNGKDTFIFKSIFGEDADIQFWADFGTDAPTDHIHVTIDDKSYFIGDLAEQQSRVLHFTLDQEKLITDFVKVLTLTVAGLFLDESTPIDVPLNVVSGLPIGFFKQNHERFHEVLSGHHQVTYHSHDGRKTTKELNINKVRMLPQPLGSVLNLLMDANGKLINKALATQKVGVVDIGFRTTDYTILDHLRYIDRGSRTSETGISKGFGVIANKLREQCGVNVELYRLYNAVESGSIKVRGQGINFAQIRDQVYSQLAASIANDIDRLWDDDWDMDAIILTGGGSKDLAKHLQPQITGNILALDPDLDPRLNNVMGYLKYGQSVWGEAGDEAAYAESESGLKPQSTPPANIESIGEDEWAEV
jgi:plasmid segregation protein ParM